MLLARVAADGRGAAEQGSHRLDDAFHALARGIEDAARGAFAVHPPANCGVRADAVHCELPPAYLFPSFTALMMGVKKPQPLR